MERKKNPECKNVLILHVYLSISLNTPPPPPSIYNYFNRYTNELFMERRYPGNVWYGISMTSFSFQIA